MWTLGCGGGLGHRGLCCAEGGRSRCPVRSLGTGQMEGRGGVAAWGAGGHLREKRPPSTSRGWKQAGGQDPPALPTFWNPGPTAQVLDLRRGRRPRWSPLPIPPEGGLPQCRQAAGCRKAGLGGGACFGVEWLSILGSPCPGLPWDLFALREERQQRASAIWAGAGSRELLSWLRSVARRGPAGLVRSGQIPGFSSTGRYCTEQEEVPIGEEGNQASLLFALSHTPGIMGFF